MSRTHKCVRYIEYERFKRVAIKENEFFSMYVVINLFKTVFSTSECSIITVKSYLVLLSIIKFAT